MTWSLRQIQINIVHLHRIAYTFAQYIYSNSKYEKFEMTSPPLTFLSFDDISRSQQPMHSVCAYTVHLHIEFHTQNLWFNFSSHSQHCVYRESLHLHSLNWRKQNRKMATELQKNDKDYQKLVELQALRNEQRNVVNNISTLELDLKEHK